MHVTVIDNTNKTIFSDFVSGGVRMYQSSGQRLLIKTDECGNVLEIGKRIEAVKRVVQKWVYDNNNPVNSLAKVYNAQDENGIIQWEKLFDPNLDSGTIKSYKKIMPTWESVLKRYDDLVNKRDVKKIPEVANQLKSIEANTQTQKTNFKSVGDFFGFVFNTT